MKKKIYCEAIKKMLVHTGVDTFFSTNTMPNIQKPRVSMTLYKEKLSELKDAQKVLKDEQERQMITEKELEYLKIQLEQKQRNEQQTIIQLQSELKEQKAELEKFLYREVYRNPKILVVRTEAQAKLKELWTAYCGDISLMPTHFRARASVVGAARAAVDYISGMTDRFCLQRHEELPARAKG